MRKQKKKFHYLYKTTNMINGNYYIGVHSTYNLKDGYLGSGTRLWNAIYKYGEENFKCEILEFFETREEVLKREKEIVNEHFLQDPFCMNLQLGGGGGLSSEEHKLKWMNSCHNSIVRKKRAKAKMDNLRNDKNWMKEYRKKLSVSAKGNKSFLGKKHKEDTKRKIGISNSISQKGKKNSQYGTKWITKNGKNKKIDKHELKTYISKGWKNGRK